MQKQLLSSLIERDMHSGSVVIFVELKLIRTERWRDELALSRRACAGNVQPSCGYLRSAL